MKPICVQCQLEYRPLFNGFLVVEHYKHGVYHLWNADLWECENCGEKLVDGFADKPLAYSNETEKIDSILGKMEAEHPEYVVHSFENLKQRADWEDTHAHNIPVLLTPEELVRYKFDPIRSDEGQNDPLERSRQEYEEQFLGEFNDDEPDKYPF